MRTGYRCSENGESLVEVVGVFVLALIKCDVQVGMFNFVSA